MLPLYVTLSCSHWYFMSICIYRLCHCVICPANVSIFESVTLIIFHIDNTSWISLYSFFQPSVALSSFDPDILSGDIISHWIQLFLRYTALQDRRPADSINFVITSIPNVLLYRIMYIIIINWSLVPVTPYQTFLQCYQHLRKCTTNFSRDWAPTIHRYITLTRGEALN